MDETGFAPLPAIPRASFSDYKVDGRSWITLVTGEYYPDVLQHARALYTPVLERFGQLLRTSESSTVLFLQIAAEPSSWLRIQLARVFKRYVSPETPVELLKKKGRAAEICEQFGATFRPIQHVQVAFDARPLPDEALCALLWEYRERGQKGYALTERFFALFRQQFPALTLIGPERAGQDVRLGKVFPDYPQPLRPVDFVVYEADRVLAIGLARYDSDRGGAQEDDRPGGYVSCVDEVLAYVHSHGLTTKMLLLNDGPGLLLGSMWDDYARIEQRWPGEILVFTLRMLPERVTLNWLRS